MKDLFLRVDIDSHVGLSKGVPNLLRLFKENDVKATFFLTAKREGNLYEYLKYKKFRSARTVGFDKTSYPKSRLKKFKDRKLEIARLLIAPRTLHREQNILKQIVAEGHELQVHCYRHIVWNNPTYQEVKNDLQKAMNVIEKITNQKPSGIATPYFSWNTGIAKAIKESPLTYISVHDDNDIKTCSESGKTNVPITIKKNKVPIPPTEYFAKMGHHDQEFVNHSLDYFKEREHKSNLLTTFIHPRIEGVELFDDYTKLIKEFTKYYNMNRTLSSLT